MQSITYAVPRISYPASPWVPNFEGGDYLMCVVQVHSMPFTMYRYLFNTHRSGGLNKYWLMLTDMSVRNERESSSEKRWQSLDIFECISMCFRNLSAP